MLSWGGWLPEATGIAADAARGRSLAELFPELVDRGLIDRLRAVVEHGEPLVLSASLHGHLIPCAPRTRPTSFTHMQQHVVATPIVGEAGVLGLTVTLEDVTARRDHYRRAAGALERGDEGERLRAIAELAADESEAGALGGALGDASWRVRAAARDAFATAGHDVDATLVEVLRSGHRDPGALNAAVDALVRRGPSVLPPLVGLLADGSEEVRTYAALTLGRVGHPAAIPDLLQTLGDPDVNVRYHAVEALGRLRALEAAPALLALAEGGDPFLAFAALDALAAIGDASLADRVAALLDVPDLADAAARALGAIGGLPHVAALVAQLGEGGPSGVAAEALVAIDRAMGGDAVAPLVSAHAGDEHVRALARELGGRSGAGADALVRVLGWIDRPEVDEHLARALERPETEAAARAALAERGQRAVPALIRVLEGGEERARSAAAAVLGELGDAGAVPALIGLLESGGTGAVAAAAALKEIGDARAFEPLLHRLGVEDVTLRHAVVGALNSIGHPDLAARAVALLDSASAHVREAAARVVGYFGGAGTASRFLSLLDDADAGVRAAAAEHLGSFEAAAPGAAHARALRDPSASVRSAAARALAQVDRDAAAALSVEAMGDSNLWVRYHAVRAAARHRSEALRERLRSLAASDPAPPVRIAALEALRGLDPGDLTGVASAALDEGDPDVAVAALGALDPGHGPSRALIERALGAAEPRIRAAAAAALVGGSEDVEPLLVAALADPDDDVQRAAAAALIERGEPSGVDAVLDLLGNPRRAAMAAEAIRAVRRPTAGSLARGLGHPDAVVRLQLVTLLRDRPEPEATPALAGALEDGAPAVRAAARRALEARDLRDAVRGRQGDAGSGRVHE